MLPFVLQPAFKDYIWGGDRLKREYGKQSELPIVAESWELSAHPAGSSVVATGPDKGMSFAELVKQHPEICGTRCAEAEEFPILIKLIDAKQSLSVQVHPDDAYARQVEQEQGKNEMWIVLANEPGAYLYFGFEHRVSREEFAQRIQNNTLTEILHAAPVKPGDVFFIRAGTIHAIGAGIVLAEVQQNSNSTYRVFDFGRVGADGKPRELHIQKAIDVTQLEPANQVAPGAQAPEVEEGYTLHRLARSSYFTVDALELHGSYTPILDGGSFVSVLCTEGGGALVCEGERLATKKGETIFVPATVSGFRLEGEGSFLLAGV